jgi:signal transduction histidine kinase
LVRTEQKKLLTSIEGNG